MTSETVYGHKKKMCLEQNISIGSIVPSMTMIEDTTSTPMPHAHHICTVQRTMSTHQYTKTPSYIHHYLWVDLYDLVIFPPSNNQNAQEVAIGPYDHKTMHFFLSKVVTRCL